MNHRQRLLEIAEFLKPYQTIWQNEILLLYPTPLKDFPKEWVEDLARIKDKEGQLKLERKEVFGQIQNPELIQYYRRRLELIEIEQSPARPPLPSDRFTFLHMIPKKQYEIGQLAPEINHCYQRHNIGKIVDIGGGVGHLAQTLTNSYGLKVISLDLDAQMQETGKDRNKKNLRPGRELVEYVNLEVKSDEPNLVAILDENTMTVGLHTCGPLAVDQIKAGSLNKNKALINLGCCYHKMHAPESQNLSRFAQENTALHMSQFALTLASRAHKKISEKDYDFKLMVKKFRYCIHFLLYDEYDVKKFLHLGNSSRKLYEGSFSKYALEQMARAGIKPKHSPQELDAYFNNEKRQELIWQMLAAGFLRDSMGRLLELYLILDRAIYLEENGYKVKLYSCFDEEISSRNIGIFATRTDH